MINVSIVLPTINEGENLKNLIPNIEAELHNTQILSYEIIVVDDGSTDNTKEIIDEFNKENEKIFLIERKEEPSLPKSIYEGIKTANYEYVLWLDADGSMSPKDVAKLAQEQTKSPNDVIIGSRFVEGGGYKGATIDSNTSIFQAMRNVYNSEDSVLAVLLSRWFNIFLARLLSFGVKDITSGFIIGKKKYFNENPFIHSSYGDYFIYMLEDLYKNGVKCKELGYLCLTRIHGSSKTGTNYFQLFKRGIPYIRAVLKIRKNNAKD
tara:strand:+ start:971 stop:1765 length:795 start_codon:yes stop_codon:yes gene_type:complete